jgi:hypothetical protein
VKGREGGTEGGREREGGTEGVREGVREGGREGGGRARERESERARERERQRKKEKEEERGGERILVIAIVVPQQRTPYLSFISIFCRFGVCFINFGLIPDRHRYCTYLYYSQQPSTDFCRFLFHIYSS